MSSTPPSAFANQVEELHDVVPGDAAAHDAPSTDLVRIGANAGIVEPKKKKKRSKKTNKVNGTGFEEYYCEPPMTPAEYEEERTVIYSSDRSFVDRIEECIQRYRARRRLEGDRNKLFSEYLLLGGVDATVRQFNSSAKISDETLQESSKSEIREMISDDVITRGRETDSAYARYFNPNFPDHWDVDFTGVASGFLSEHIVRQVGNDIVMIAIAADVISNFLKYVLHHDVCPEYEDDINNALEVCDVAVEEAQAIAAICEMLPSPFSTALRVLKCKEDEDDEDQTEVTVTEQQAIITVAAIASILLPELAKASGNNQEWNVVDTSTHAFEVCKIKLPDDKMKAKLVAINRFNPKHPDVEACGTFTARRTIILDGWDHLEIELIPDNDKGEVEFVLEESILKLLKPGMKLTMSVCTTSLGWKFIKRIKDIMPSYYNFLPQTLMLTFKPPVPSERPAPNVYGKEDFNINDVPIGDKDEE
ncbi:Argonaute complex, subunit Arb1 [Cladorrhinum sp. PSN259]|nr:Argonaute complex, subunit Arb1 [Cladorrhinum sp. PSN259]